MTHSSAKATRMRVRVGRAALGAADRARLTALRWQGFASRWVDTAQGRVHVLELRGDESSQTPIVLLHGLSSCAVDYAPVIKHLLPHARHIVVPDLPGHGQSQIHGGIAAIEPARRALTEALDHVLERPAVVFGNSLGGAAGLRYANASPDRVRGLILASPGGARISREQLDELLENFRVADAAGARAFLERVSAAPHWSHAVFALALRHRFEQPGVRDLVELASTDDMLDPAELARLPMPVLLLWGREEKLFGRDQLEFFRRHLPSHATVEEPAGFGHAPFLDRPRALAQRILRFARELD